MSNIIRDSPLLLNHMLIWESIRYEIIQYINSMIQDAVFNFTSEFAHEKFGDTLVQKQAIFNSSICIQYYCGTL